MNAGIAPWLLVADGRRAVDFYTAAFGAHERYRLEEEARVIVAQLDVGGADFWIQEDPGFSPVSDGETIRMILTVDDPVSLHGRAVVAGATEIRPVSEDHGWLVGRLADPFGHHWEIGRPLSGLHGG
jgi:PhnB protein